MQKKKPSDEVVSKVYRIPSKKWFNSTHVENWKEIYGKAKCCKCHRNFKELELYVAIDVIKYGRPAVKFRHVECPPKVEDKDGENVEE